MTKKIECPTCEGEGKIYDRRVDNRDEEEEEVISKKEIEKHNARIDKLILGEGIRQLQYTYMYTNRYTSKI